MSSTDDYPLRVRDASLLTRFWLCLATWTMKGVVTIVFSLLFKLSRTLRKLGPTLIKHYEIKPRRTSNIPGTNLESRIFIPISRKAERLPLYVDMHGGGFFAGQARGDDKFCHYVANKFNMIVASIEYRLAPKYPFPVPVDDCVDLILLMLSDPDILAMVDKEKVVIGGQSAGGTLALTASQDSRLRNKIRALVAFYPATDFSRRFTGPYRDIPAGLTMDGKPHGRKRDGLRGIVPMAEWAYVPRNANLRDPKLSPVYVEREHLPQNVCIVAAKWDMLALEAFVLAKKISGTMGKDMKEEADSDNGGVKWMRVEEAHGFIDNGLIGAVVGDEKPWNSNVQNTLDEIEGWLGKVLEVKP